MNMKLVGDGRYFRVMSSAGAKNGKQKESCGQLYKIWINIIQWLNHGYLQNLNNILDSDCMKYISKLLSKKISNWIKCWITLTGL